MKTSFLYKLVPLALAAILAGCSPFGEASPRSDKMHENESFKLVDTAVAEPYPFLPEYPNIDSDISFSDEAVIDSVQNMAVKKAPDEVKSVWISFLEMQHMLTKKTETEFRRNMKTVFNNIHNYGLNTVVIQVRPYADAFYKSDYFPWSFLITGTEGKDPGFDPFQIMVEEARAKGLRIEAWVNPYRIRPADRKDALCAENQAKIWLDAKDDSVINYKGIISFNPASSKAQNLIVNGIVELARNYDIDAVHIDDYFYPTSDRDFDKASYSRYQQNGGKLPLENWRRQNVETLIKKIYNAVKQTNKNMLFGISPQSSIGNNLNEHYLDVQKISSNPGYCDYICPQIYFGFRNEKQPYSETLRAWSNMVTAPGVKLYVGLAAYKVGTVDTWAGANGKNEWINNSDMMRRMTQEARKYDNYGGVVLFRYDFIFNPSSSVKAVAQKEFSNLKGILK